MDGIDTIVAIGIYGGAQDTMGNATMRRDWYLDHADGQTLAERCKKI
jgi:hypothetical protein